MPPHRSQTLASIDGTRFTGLPMNPLRIALARSMVATALGAATGAAVLLLLGHVSSAFAAGRLLPQLWWHFYPALPAATGAVFSWATVDAATKRHLRSRRVQSPPWPQASLRRHLLLQSVAVAVLPPALIGLTLWHFILMHGDPPRPDDRDIQHVHGAAHDTTATIAASISGKGASSYDHGTLLSLIALMLVASAIAAARLAGAAASAVTEPLDDLVAGLQRIKEGDLAHRLSVLTGDELGRAAALFNEMAARVAERAWLHEAFGRYVSRDVAAAILDGRITTAGEQLEVSLLFADIRGFTTLSEKLPPVELLQFLNRYLSRMISVVSHRGGRLDKVMGDGLFFVFGAPVPNARHAQNAVNSALDMRAALVEFNREAAVAGRPPLKIGIGVHTGQVVAGSIGSPEHKLEYTVLGDAVNVAARVEGLTKDLEQDILVTSSTRDRVDDPSVTFAALQPVQVRGRAEKVLTYAVVRG